MKLLKLMKIMLEVEEKASSLLDMKLDGKVNDELFEMKNKEIQKEILDQKSRQDKIESVNIEKIQAIQEKMVELTGSLYRSYKSGDNSYRSLILKNMMVELFVSNKKELTLAENKLFGFIKSVNVSNGAQMTADTRTAIKEFVENYDKVKEKYHSVF